MPERLPDAIAAFICPGFSGAERRVFERALELFPEGVDLDVLPALGRPLTSKVLGDLYFRGSTGTVAGLSRGIVALVDPPGLIVKGTAVSRKDVDGNVRVLVLVWDRETQEARPVFLPAGLQASQLSCVLQSRNALLSPGVDLIARGWATNGLTLSDDRALREIETRLPEGSSLSDDDLKIRAKKVLRASEIVRQTTAVSDRDVALVDFKRGDLLVLGKFEFVAKTLAVVREDRVAVRLWDLAAGEASNAWIPSDWAGRWIYSPGFDDRDPRTRELLPSPPPSPPPVGASDAGAAPRRRGELVSRVAPRKAEVGRRVVTVSVYGDVMLVELREDGNRLGFAVKHSLEGAIVGSWDKPIADFAEAEDTFEREVERIHPEPDWLGPRFPPRSERVKIAPGQESLAV